jgi:hypothetical protein
MESIQTSIIAPATQQDHETEARVLQTCAKAKVCCIGIQSGFGITADMVLFQKPSTTLSVPLAAFADPETAIELIQAKLDQSEKLFQSGKATEGLPLQGMSEAERLDLEHEIGRAFIDGKQAHEYRFRKLKQEAVNHDLDRVKRTESGKLTRDFAELLVVAMLAFAIGFATATAICLGH